MLLCWNFDEEKNMNEMKVLDFVKKRLILELARTSDNVEKPPIDMNELSMKSYYLCSLIERIRNVIPFS